MAWASLGEANLPAAAGPKRAMRQPVPVPVEIALVRSIRGPSQGLAGSQGRPSRAVGIAVPGPVGQGEPVAGAVAKGIEDRARPEHALNNPSHGDLAVLVRQVTARPPPDAAAALRDRARTGADDKIRRELEVRRVEDQRPARRRRRRGRPRELAPVRLLRHRHRREVQCAAGPGQADLCGA